MLLHLFLLMLAFILLLLQAFNISMPRISFGWLGLALLVLSQLLTIVGR